MLRLPLAFDAVQAKQAWDLYGANCGPGALAAVSGVSVEEAVYAIPGFLEKGHTKETMLRSALEGLGIPYREGLGHWPFYGMVRIIFEGPWSGEGLYARFAHSHWVGHSEETEGPMVFDINAMGVGGWLPRQEWIDSCLPWLIERYEPLCNGQWTLHESFDLSNWRRGEA